MSGMMQEGRNYGHSYENCTSPKKRYVYYSLDVECDVKPVEPGKANGFEILTH